jgi:tRNA modification GTPase
MIEISGYAAAILDYPSDDLPENIGAQLIEQTLDLYDEINGALSGYAAVRAVRSGFNIVLTGDTNVGKSSLFNRLAGYSRAIVSDIPGTTRDVVGIELDMDGYLVRLSDTAGIRESGDAIENMGVMRAREEIKNADLILRVYAGKAGEVAPAADNEIIVFNKSDLNPNGCAPRGAILVSALTGDGVSELLDAVKQKIQKQLNGAESDLAVSERALALLADAAERLGDALAVGDANYDLFADHVRAAADAAGRILGVIGADEIADATFGQLCLGK